MYASQFYMFILYLVKVSNDFYGMYTITADIRDTIPYGMVISYAPLALLMN